MYQAGSACYSTPAAALSATVSAQSGTVVVDGGVAKVLTVSAVGDPSPPRGISTVTYTLTSLGGGPSTSSVVSVMPQPCGLLTAQDGLQMAWMAASAWIVVYAVLFVTRAFRGETVDNYGNT